MIGLAYLSNECLVVIFSFYFSMRLQENYAEFAEQPLVGTLCMAS
jgi:hypothetical protein